jgi:pyrimidine operon attenuation protein/uracil phosphoribosyltransferase
MTTQQNDINKLIKQMANELQEKFVDTNIKEAVMVGIHTGGVWVAEELHALLSIEQPLAQLDISFYRDDFSRIGMNPQVKPSKLPVSVDDAHIILVDDILHTGRTIRAALNEIFDYGRPASVTLAVLGNRSGRELPIQADVVGKQFQLGRHEHVKLTGPDPLQLEIVEAP